MKVKFSETTLLLTQYIVIILVLHDFKVRFSLQFFIFSSLLTDDCFSLEIQIDTDD